MGWPPRNGTITSPTRLNIMSVNILDLIEVLLTIFPWLPYPTSMFDVCRDGTSSLTGQPWPIIVENPLTHFLCYGGSIVKLVSNSDFYALQLIHGIYYCPKYPANIVSRSTLKTLVIKHLILKPANTLAQCRTSGICGILGKHDDALCPDYFIHDTKTSYLLSGPQTQAAHTYFTFSK